MPQIIPIVSETLQSTIRRLLPSQNGFGEDLQAQNVIVPIIDVTPSAEGSSLPVDLSRSLAFGSQTVFNITNTTTTIASTPGFYRIIGTMSGENSTAAVKEMSFILSNGFSEKIVYGMDVQPEDPTKLSYVLNYDFNVFIPAGITLSGKTNSSNLSLVGSIRQIATSTGELVNPAGFNG